MQLGLASRQLSVGTARAALLLYLSGSTRCYVTSHPVVKHERKPAVHFARPTPNKREVAPSPLSPFARISASKSNKSNDSQARGAASQYPAKPTGRTRKAEKPRAVQSTAPRGLSSPRKLLVTPATPRISRVPVWARPPTATTSEVKKKRAPSGKSWSEHRATVKSVYPDRWNPTKKISREAMQALRELHKADPEKYPSWTLAQRFKISPEAVRRILKSNWTMSEERKEEKVMRERRTRIERMKRMREEEMHQMVRAGIKLKVHPDDRLDLT